MTALLTPSAVVTVDPLKPWKTLQAEAMLAGLVAHLGADDAGQPELIVCYGALTQAFIDIEAARVFLAKWRRLVAGPTA